MLKQNYPLEAPLLMQLEGLWNGIAIG